MSTWFLIGLGIPTVLAGILMIAVLYDREVRQPKEIANKKHELLMAWPDKKLKAAIKEQKNKVLRIEDNLADPLFYMRFQNLVRLREADLRVERDVLLELRAELSRREMIERYVKKLEQEKSK